METVRQEGRKTIYSRLTGMNLTLVAVTAALALVGTLTITLRQERRAIDEKLSNSAQIIAQLPEMAQALSGQGDDWLTAYLDSTVDAVTDIDLILLVDSGGTVRYSQDHNHIGQAYPGEDTAARVLAGEDFVAPETALEEAERCAFVPILSGGGEVAGFVVVGIHSRSLLALTAMTVLQFLVVVAVAGAVAMLLSRQASRRIKDELMGYEPDDFRRLFHRQEEVLESLEEGVVAIDRDGRVIYLNGAAVRLLGLESRESAVGHTMRELGRPSNLRRVLQTGRMEYNVSVEGRPGERILSDRMPIRQDGRVVGAVAIFRSRTEVTRLAEDLTGVRHMVEAMRAYTHEFMNKLHVILGLLQMEKYDTAKEYITDVTRVQQQAVARIADRIADPMAAALLVGKTSRAAELGIRLVLDPTSTLSGDGRFLPSATFVTILGNLITNAIDSLNHAGGDPKEITVSIREEERGLLLCVEDTGPGIDPAVLPHIFEPGFSTKGQDRGTGLPLVRELVELYHGEIRVESQRDVGAVFFVTFREDKEG